MNINDLKKEWQNDNTGEIDLNASLLKLKTANLPKDQIHRSLKRELVMQLIVFAILSLLPILFHYKQPYFTTFYIFQCAGLMLSLYHIRRFKVFTRKIGHNTLNSKNHLYELYYDVRLVMELYKSWTYLVFPFGIIFGVLHHIALGADPVKILTSYKLVVIIIALFVALLFTEIYINRVFGKYTRQLKQLLDELSEA